MALNREKTYWVAISRTSASMSSAACRARSMAWRSGISKGALASEIGLLCPGQGSQRVGVFGTVSVSIGSL